jgi:hypothetical protein
MIVKIQRSQPPTPLGSVLIYDEKRSFIWTGPVEPDMDEWLGKRQKAYAHAHLKSGVIVVEKTAKWQEW